MATTIQVNVDTREQLKAVGRKGETYDAIIQKLLEKSKYVEFVEDQYSILRAEKKWTKLSDLP